jgi:hypothetical protein
MKEIKVRLVVKKQRQEIWTMAWFIWMMVLLPVSTRGADLVIPAEPAQVEIRDVKFYRVSYGFQEGKQGRFQLQVTLRYRKWTSQIERVKRFTLRLQSGTIVQRDDRTLTLRFDNREMVVGKHRWWYDPYWQAANGVQIACDRDREFRDVIIKNCRLMVEKPASGESNRPAYPAAERTSFTRDVIAIREVASRVRHSPRRTSPSLAF